MPTPTTTAGHYDPLLSNVSVAYFQNPGNFVSRRVMANVPVAEKSGTYWEFDKSATLRPAKNTLRPLGGRPNQVGYDASKRTFSCEEHSLEGVLDDRQKANYSTPHSGERMTVKVLTQQMLMDQEIEWAAAYWKTGVWGSDIAGVTSAPSASQEIFWNLATGVPVAAIKRRSAEIHKRTGGQTPNTLVLGMDVWLALEQSSDILSRIQNTQRGVVPLDLLSSMFDIPNVYVAKAVQNLANEGLTASIDWIVSPKSALLAYVAPEPALEQPSAGYTMSWTGLAGSQALTNIATVTRGRDERAKSEWFQVQSAYDFHLVSSDCATYFNAIVQ